MNRSVCACSVTKLPLLVDIDTGFGAAFNIARTVGCHTIA